MLDIFDISNVGTGSSLSSTLVASIPIQPYIPTASGGILPTIDIIADYDNLVNGYPLCDKFVVTYAQNRGTFGDIIGYASSLNNPAIFKTTIVASGIAVTTSYVAGIQRINAMSTIDDVALFTYNFWNGSNQQLFYQEWNITQNTVSASTLLYTSLFTIFPDIAAIDDYHINDPTIPHPLAYYNVSACIDSTSPTNRNKIINFNNLLPGGLDITTTVFAGLPRVLGASVCAGPCENYSVQFQGNFSSTVGGTLLQSTEWKTGYPVGYNSLLPNPFTNVNYYLESTTGGGVLTATCNAASPNYATNALAYADVLNGSGGYDIYYKMIDCSLAFKTAPTNVANVTQTSIWTIAPNPAIDMLTLTGSNITTGDNYTVTDITGRVLQNAPITSTREPVDISSIAPGLYLLNVYSNGQRVNTIKFVKE